MGKIEKINLVTMNPDGKTELKVEVEGYSNMPFWNHDLKLKAALLLIQSTDYKEFVEDNKYEEMERFRDDIIESINYALGFDV
ncbi:hypothetical protein [Brevibacillus laterosporus]|uniref:hypothetical protein n=1 Tax=Brevibacillus laterosporus TaxID=1465 RepID=UPI001EF20565|nr:hypothetical protein [Brevibacillus laterosporus]MCG7317912.1 hypothetical protein [Brevibacillus laterosporus]